MWTKEDIKDFILSVILPFIFIVILMIYTDFIRKVFK